MENHVKNVSAQTANPGSGWTKFDSDVWCSALRIHNNTGTQIEVRRFGGGTVFIPIQNLDKVTLFGIKKAEDLEVRRVDQSNTQVTVLAEAITFK